MSGDYSQLKKRKRKLVGKSLRNYKKAQKEKEEREIETLKKRIKAEAPPTGVSFVYLFNTLFDLSVVTRRVDFTTNA